MKAISVLKKTLPGLLPLFVYIASDEIWGGEIALYIALAFGLLQVVFIYLKEKRLDKFVLFDLLLILIMGAVSLILQNPIFFKLKPAIIGLIVSVFLGISVFSEHNLLILMSQNYLKGFEISEEQKSKMKKTLSLLFWMCVCYTLLVFYSAIFMSKESWGFISGILFYILLAAVFLFEFLRNFFIRRKNSKEEILPLVNEDGNVIGSLTRTHAHDGSKKLHPVVHLHILDDKFNILLQKRSLSKSLLPGKWDSAVGGHISQNETIETALRRETFEELGLKINDFDFIARYIWESDTEKELVFVFITNHNAFDFYPNSEVDEVKYWSVDEICEKLDSGIFTPNFIVDFNNILLAQIRYRKNQRFSNS